MTKSEREQSLFSNSTETSEGRGCKEQPKFLVVTQRTKVQKDERKVGERSHVISSGKMGKKRFVKQLSPLVEI